VNRELVDPEDDWGFDPVVEPEFFPVLVAVGAGMPPKPETVGALPPEA